MQSSTINLPTVTPVGLRLKATKMQTPVSMTPKLQSCRRLQLLKTAAATNNDPATVDYTSSTTSVFPAEACETIGGEACQVDMYPEAKLESSQPSPTAASASVSNPVDREYLQYDEPKTVFPAEACDDLGGEFCDPEYQTGVY